ncbi:MAG: phosphotransferase, partial [Deltaproteobacteria bacterium]|nr:phosphotransferase [Deltaproteobacteria bacterium]
MPSLIKDLSHPAALPDPTSAVHVVQTHISIVFVGDDYVYKVKKPVDFGFLDFTTLEKRRHFCKRELKLNRRLSKQVYLDVLPVRFKENRFSMTDTSGDIVEYAVRMKRIPDERLMKSVFDRKEITREHLYGIASVLSKFHSTAARSSEIDDFGQPEMFRVNTDENFEQVKKYVGLTVEKEAFAALRMWTDDFYDTNRALFLQRIREGRIRDCHGDLHMEHICIMEGYPIIDCIEFNNRFRYSDTLADIAFLVMDLEYWGDAEAAGIFWKSYKDMAGEGNVEHLLTFYKVYRAFVRGKVIGFQVDDDRIGKREKDEAVRRAARYFRLAAS